VNGFLADFLNPSAYDNGEQLQELLHANSMNQWLLALECGILLFIAFRTMFPRL